MKTTFPKPKLEDVLKYQEIEDLLFACSCVAERYLPESGGENKTPNYLYKAIDRLEKKLWAARRRLLKKGIHE